MRALKERLTSFKGLPVFGFRKKEGPEDLLSRIYRYRDPSKAAQFLERYYERLDLPDIHRLLRDRPKIADYLPLSLNHLRVLGQHESFGAAFKEMLKDSSLPPLRAAHFLLKYHTYIHDTRELASILSDLPEVRAALWEHPLSDAHVRMFPLIPSQEQMEALKLFKASPFFKKAIWTRDFQNKTFLHRLAETQPLKEVGDYLSLFKQTLSSSELERFLKARDNSGKIWLHYFLSRDSENESSTEKWEILKRVGYLVSKQAVVEQLLTPDKEGITPLFGFFKLSNDNFTWIRQFGSFLYFTHLSEEYLTRLRKEAIKMILYRQRKISTAQYDIHLEEEASPREEELVDILTPNNIRSILLSPSLEEWMRDLKKITQLFEKAFSSLPNWTPGALSFDEKEFVKKALKLSQEFLLPYEREKMVLQLPILQVILKTALIDKDNFSEISALLKASVHFLHFSANPVKDLMTKASVFHYRNEIVHLARSIINPRLQYLLSKAADSYIKEIFSVSTIRDALLEEMLMFITSEKRSLLNTPQLSSTILPFIQLAAPNMSEENHKILSYILGFIALDRRPEISDITLRVILFGMDWNAFNWKDAIFNDQLFSPPIAKIFSHKDILGKRGKWNRQKLPLLREVVFFRTYPPKYFFELLQILEELVDEKAVKRAYYLLEFYLKRESALWKSLVLQYAREEDFKRKVTEEYLFQLQESFSQLLGIRDSGIKKVIPSVDPILMEYVMEWVTVFKRYPQYLPVFQHFFSLSPEEYKKERYKGFNVPPGLKEAWLKDYRQQVTYVPAEKGAKKEQLLQAIQDFNNHLKEKEWEGPWLEPSLLEEDPFTNLRKFEEEIIQKAPSSLRDMIAYDLRRIRSLISTGEVPPNLTFLITDSRELLFRMGKGPRINSCQAPDYPGYYKIGLLGAIANPWVKMATLVDEKGQIIGRAKLYLLKKDDGYYVMVDKYYGYGETKELLVKRLTEVLKEWKAQGLIEGYYPFERGEGEPAGPFRAPIYTDLGINGQSVVINPGQI